MRSVIIALVGILALCHLALAGDPDQLSGEDQRLSYALGMELGFYYRSLDQTFDLAALARGIEDGLQGREPLLGPEEAKEVEKKFAERQQALERRSRLVLAHDNLAAAYKFLVKNKKREGVVTTSSGLQYEVIKAGQGKKPNEDSRVQVQYRGTLLDGTEFDSTYSKGKPAVFELEKTIPGFREGLQLMPVGSTYKFYMPSDLAYGDRGAGTMVQPGAMLIYEVELLKIL